MKRRVLSLFLALLLTFGGFSAVFARSADEASREVYSSSCGANLTWEFDPATGVLTISGAGDMYSFYIEGDPEYDRYPPWYEYASQITSVVIEDGVTGIGSYAFYQFNHIESVIMGANVRYVGECAFKGCSSISSIVLSESLVSIYLDAFCDCSSLTSITFPESISFFADDAFCSCSSLSEAIFLGAPPAQFDCFVFDNAAPDFCIYYMPEHASEWAPNGETTWNGYPIAPYSPPQQGCSFDFETNPSLDGWTFIDSDGDGETWQWTGNNTAAHSGYGMLYSRSYDNASHSVLYPDNWAYCPQIAVPDDQNYSYLAFYAEGYDPQDHAEVFRVYANVGGTDIAISEDLTAASEFQRIVIDVSAFAGQTVSFAIRHYNISDMFMIIVDDFEVFSSDTAIEGASVPELPKPVLAVSSADAEPGDDISITLSVEGDYSASVLQVKVLYDSSVMTLSGNLKRGSVWADAADDGAFGMSNLNVAGEIGFTLMSPSVDFSGEGVVFTANFHVSESAASGVYPITLQIVSFAQVDSSGNIADIEHEIVNGALTISGSAPAGLIGDVDCNGTVDFDDVTLLNAYLLNAAELSEQGLINANVNGDNKVSSADVVALNKLILGSN